MMSGGQREVARHWDECMVPYHWVEGAAMKLAWGETASSGGSVHPAGKWDYAGPEPQQAWHMRRLAPDSIPSPQVQRDTSDDASGGESSDLHSDGSDADASENSEVGRTPRRRKS